VLTVLQNATACAPGNLTVPFAVSGGSSPYTWAVVPGGAGGTIDSDGTYTSPLSSIGPDTITVTDSTSPTPQVGSTTMLVGYPLMLVCDIIQNCMGLSGSQVWLWEQKIFIPTDSQLYVAVGVQSCRPFSNRPSYSGGGSAGAPLTATQSVNMQATLTIDILSRGPIARDMKEQVLLALSSPYAQQQMELNSFLVASLSTGFVNLSQVDGAAIPYRFQILVALQYFSTLTTQPAYFSSFGSVAVTPNP
jgi:hypothetical protein